MSYTLYIECEVSSYLYIYLLTYCCVMGKLCWWQLVNLLFWQWLFIVSTFRTWCNCFRVLFALWSIFGLWVKFQINSKSLLPYLICCPLAAICLQKRGVPSLPLPAFHSFSPSLPSFPFPALLFSSGAPLLNSVMWKCCELSSGFGQSSTAKHFMVHFELTS